MRRRVDDVVGSHDERHVGRLELVIDLVHLFELVVGDVRLGQQHIHVAGHAARDRVDGVFDLNATLLELVGEFADRVLALGDRQAVAGDDDHLPRIGEQGGDVLRRSGPDGFSFTADRARRPGRRRTEGAEEDVAERAAHGVTHQLGEQRAGGTDEGAGHDQREIPENEATGRNREAGKRVQHGNDDRHVRSADGQHEGDAKDQPEDQQRDEDDGRRHDRDQVEAQREDGQREHAVDDLLAGIGNRGTGHQGLQLGESHQAAGEGDGADHDAEDTGKGEGKWWMRALQEQLGDGDERGGPPTDAIEERHHLRDGGHLDAAGAEGPDRDPDQKADQRDHDARLGEVQKRDRRQQRDRHAHGGDLVAAARASRRAQLDEADDEEHRGHEIGEGDRHRHPGFFSSCAGFPFCADVGRPLNISSIRSVTTKPPTTLMVARMTATRPRAICSGSWAVAAIRMAPTRMMPWMAFVPDMSGVWRIVGTLEITSKPTKIASTKTVNSLSRLLSFTGSLPPPALWHAR